MQRQGTVVEIEGEAARAVPSAQFATLSLVQRALVAAFLACGVWYLAWRPTAFNPEATIFSAVVYAAELFGFTGAILFLATCWRLRRRTALPVPANASVTVLVTTTSESVDVVRRTLMAVQRMKHAHDVWLLDHGDRLEMQALAEELGCHCLPQTGRGHDQANRLNLALAHTRAEFVAVLDADHIPAPAFLEETLGFFADDRVAVVQTPQDFYNLDSFQHRFDRRESLVWNEQSLFHRVVQPGKDRLGAALYCGSCAVLRRSALDDIGGFPAGDGGIRTSIRLHKRGWRSVYYARSLVFCRAPTSAIPFLERRLRAAQEAMRAWRQEGIVFARGLTFGQRISYLATVLEYFVGWQRAIYFLAPIGVLTTGVLPIASVDAILLAHVVPYYFLAWWVFEEVARGYGRRLLVEQYTLMRFAVLIAATCGVCVRRIRDVATPTREEGVRAARRGLWPQYLVLGLNGIAIPAGLVLYWGGDRLSTGALVASLLWASGTLGIAAVALRCALRASRSRRREYRFPLPVPLRVRSGRSLLIGLATDISPFGCRVMGGPVNDARGGAELGGDLLLPTGPLPVRLVVRTVLADGATAAPVALGCEFRWGLSDERDQLEMFLFGSDLQWRINGFEDRVHTPLERVGDLLAGKSPARRLAGRDWSPVLYGSVNDAREAGIGYISAPARAGESRTIVSLAMLPTGGRLHAEEVTPAGPRSVVGRVAVEQVIDAHSAPIYIYELTG